MEDSLSTVSQPTPWPLSTSRASHRMEMVPPSLQSQAVPRTAASPSQWAHPSPTGGPGCRPGKGSITYPTLTYPAHLPHLSGWR